MTTGSAENPVANPPGTAHRVRVIIFRVVAALAGLFFVVAVVLMASAPWVLLQPDQDVRTELNRWFLTVAGSVDAITAGVLLALAQQPRRTLLVVELVGAVIVAGAIILPIQPSFTAILAIGVVPLIAYPYWRGRANVSLLVGGHVPCTAHLRRIGRCRASRHGGNCISPADRRNRSGGPRGLVVGLCRARDRARSSRSARRQPRTRLAHPERSVQRGLAIPGTSCVPDSPAQSRIVGSYRRRRGTAGRPRFWPRRVARIRT
jgi:hypothetical protein